jgi:hypothetical protein
VCLRLTRKSGRGYRRFEYLDSKVVTWQSLEVRRPGISAALERQLEGRSNDPVPIATLVCDADGPFDLSTVTYGFNIDIPPLDISFEDAKACLQEYITSNINRE